MSEEESVSVSVRGEKSRRNWGSLLTEDDEADGFEDLHVHISRFSRLKD